MLLYASDADGYKRKLISGIIHRRERARKPFGETSSNVWERRQLLPWHGDHAALFGEHRERRVRGEEEGWLQTLFKREGDEEATTNGGFLWLSPVGDQTLGGEEKREGKKSRARE